MQVSIASLPCYVLAKFQVMSEVISPNIAEILVLTGVCILVLALKIELNIDVIRV